MYRPEAWSAQEPQLYVVETLPYGATQQYVFDLVQEYDESADATITKNPVQNSSAITDHVIVNPRSVSMRVRVSDTVQSYLAGLYGESQKYKNAYALFNRWRTEAALLQVATRMTLYENAVLQSFSAPSNVDNVFSGDFVLNFSEIIIAEVDVRAVSSTSSARSQVTGASALGTKQGVSTPSSTVQAHTVTQPNIAPADAARASAWFNEQLSKSGTGATSSPGIFGQGGTIDQWLSKCGFKTKKPV